MILVELVGFLKINQLMFDLDDIETESIRHAHGIHLNLKNMEDIFDGFIT